MATLRPQAIRSLHRAASSPILTRSITTTVTDSSSSPATRSYASPRYTPSRAPQTPTESNLATSRVAQKFLGPQTSPAATALPASIRENLPLLAAQSPHYITVHVHGRPYLVTAGDTVRLPFLMHGVAPGDVLRLNRASVLGSRDYTLAAGSGEDSDVATALLSPSLRSSNTGAAADAGPPAVLIQGNTSPPKDNVVGDYEEGGHAPTATAGSSAGLRRNGGGKDRYLDERLFVCRAVVLGTEAEPLRVKEKTKQRQRRVKTVKSKHRYTVLRIREISVSTVAEIEGLQL